MGIRGRIVLVLETQRTKKGDDQMQVVSQREIGV